MLGLKIGIDFGSTNITIYSQDKGIVMSEPSVLICDSETGRPLAVGSAAHKMANKLPLSMNAVYPIKDGIINDFDSACFILRTYINRLCQGKILKPTALMCVPSVVTELQKKTLFDAVMASGAGRACFVEETLAAAAGAGLDFLAPKANLVCDIGGGTCNVAVITMGGIAVSETIDVGGSTLTRSVEDYIAHKYNIKIGADTAENIKISVGGAIKRIDENAVIQAGKEYGSGKYVYFEVTSTEIYGVLKKNMSDILSCIMRVLEKTSPELSADIKENGILITGGTAGLYGIADYFEQKTGLPVRAAKNPEKCAALGLGRLLKDINYLERRGYVFRSNEVSAEKES